MVELEGQKILMHTFIYLYIHETDPEQVQIIVSGAPFKKFASVREEWAIKNRYLNPGTVFVELGFPCIKMW